LKLAIFNFYRMTLGLMSQCSGGGDGTGCCELSNNILIS